MYPQMLAGDKELSTALQKAKDLQLFVKSKLSIDLPPLTEDISDVVNRCCENVVGFKKTPLAVSNRPIKINNHSFVIPLSTTEGCLVASMCRGIKALNASNTLQGYVENLGITRSFAMKFSSFATAMSFYKWLKNSSNIDKLKVAGNMNSNFTRIKEIESKFVFSDEVYIKVYAYTGDAMGMNMITKACMQISDEIKKAFPTASLVCVSANICTDKKWSVENYCNGRGRRVFLSAEVPGKVCEEVLKVTVDQLIGIYQTKIVVGSQMVLGSSNCQAANYVAAIFLALGQDLGQVIESSNCTLQMKKKGDSLYVSLFMPSIVVGCIGGGTHLGQSKDLLRQFYLPDSEFIITDRTLDKATSSSYLALAIAGAVLAGELSCLASLADGSLLDAHMELNRGRLKL